MIIQKCSFFTAIFVYIVFRVTCIRTSTNSFGVLILLSIKRQGQDHGEFTSCKLSYSSCIDHHHAVLGTLLDTGSNQWLHRAAIEQIKLSHPKTLQLASKLPLQLRSWSSQALGLLHRQTPLQEQHYSSSNGSSHKGNLNQ